MVEEILIEKSGKVVVDGDRVVKIVEDEKSSVKSVKQMISGLNCQKTKDIGIMKPTIKLGKLSPEVIFFVHLS